MFWLFWQLVGVCLAIGGGALALMAIVGAVSCLGWLIALVIVAEDRRLASIARAEAAREERLRAANP